MKNPTTLILDRKSIEALVDMKSAIRAVEKVFVQHALGRTVMPPKIYLDLPQFGGDFRAMPAYAQGIGKCAVKWVNAHAKNARHGFPSVMALIILNDPKTGFPLSIMDATALTSIRTGAAGGVAAKYLACQKSQRVGLVGCGVQAKTQLLALREIFKIKSVKVWGKETRLAQNFVKQMQRSGETMSVCSSVKDCVGECDIVVTTTPSRKPIVQRSWIKNGTHINAIGADAAGKQELDPLILKNGKVVVDDYRQASHSGEINVPVSKGYLTEKNIYAQLGQIVCGNKKGRSSDEEITIFDSTGLAIQDLALADLVYRKALKRNVGQKVNLLGL